MGDAGRYTCEALNQAGRSEKHYNLNVWGEGLGGWAGVPPLSLPWLALMPPEECCLHGPGIQAFSVPRPCPFPAQHLPHTPLCSPPVPPVFPSREPRILTVTEGHPARLSCECRGVPFPKISWRKDGMIASLAQPRPGCPPQWRAAPCPRWVPPPAEPS